MGVYINGDMEKKLEELADWVGESENGLRIIGGGF